MATISAINYKKVFVTEFVNEWTLSPFDGGGKPLQSMTIEVDTSDGQANIYLPQISGFAGVFFTKIIISSANSGGSPIYIYPNEADSIGGLGQILVYNSGNAVLTPVTSNEWSAIQTPGSVPA